MSARCATFVCRHTQPFSCRDTLSHYHQHTARCSTSTEFAQDPRHNSLTRTTQHATRLRLTLSCVHLANARAASPLLQTQFLATYESEADGWRGGLQPYGPMSLLPSSQALNYGQSIFEGMKVCWPLAQYLAPAKCFAQLWPVHLRGHEGAVLSLSSAQCSLLNYGQSIFEGMKVCCRRPKGFCEWYPFCLSFSAQRLAVNCGQSIFEGMKLRCPRPSACLGHCSAQ